MVKNPPAHAGDCSLIPDLERFHMPWSSETHVPSLLSLCFRAWETQLLKPVHLEPGLAIRDTTTMRSLHTTARESSPTPGNWRKA